MVARFYENIPTVFIIGDLEKFWVLTEIIILPFFIKLEFSRVLQNIFEIFAYIVKQKNKKITESKCL